MLSFNDDEMYEYRDYLQNDKGFKYLGSGDFRTCFLRKKILIKIPRNHDGLIDNIIEAHAWKVYNKSPTIGGIYLAPCRLLSNGCLMMVYVDQKPLSYGKIPSPDWVNTLDHCQAGLYKGRVVAFDYAIDLIERHEWEAALNVESDFFKNDYSRTDCNTHVHAPGVKIKRYCGGDEDEYEEEYKEDW